MLKFLRMFSERPKSIILAGLVLMAGLAILARWPRPASPESPEGAGPAEQAEPLTPAATDSRGESDPDIPPDAPEVPLAAPALPAFSAATAPPPAAPLPAAPKPATYDERIAALLDAVQTVRSAGPEASRNVSHLLASAGPQDQVAGLVLTAGLGSANFQADFSRHSPETALAAVDLCQALLGEAPARRLLEQWQASVGGNPAAGEKAHDLLLAARLPYGGGATALELMVGVNDPQSILIGLYEFAVDPHLPAAVRTEALVRLRDHMDVETFQNIAQTCIAQVQEAKDEWAPRAERLREWALAPVVDRRFVDGALSRPYPGLVADLESHLRRGLAAERVQMDREAAVYFRETLANLPPAGLTGPDRAAALSLRRQLDSWQPAP